MTRTAEGKVKLDARDWFKVLAALLVQLGSAWAYWDSRFDDLTERVAVLEEKASDTDGDRKSVV